jgi:DHA1 family bicyclomycin/chloramphenicol resistance-like MFS transporter
MNSLSDSAAAAPSRRTQRALILGSLAAFGPLSLDMYLPALPTLAEELNTTASMIQLTLTACLLGLALGQLFAGPLSDVLGRRKPLIIALIIYSVSSILCVFAPSVELLIVFRLIQGLSGSAGIVISRAIVRDLYSGTELTKFFATLMLINGAAPILAPIFGGQLLQFMSWRGVFVALTVYGVIMLIAVVSGLPESLPAERRQSGGLGQTLSTFGRLLGDRQFVGYCLSQGLVMAGMFAYISGSSFVLQNLYEVSEQTYSLIFAMNGVGIIAASQVAGRLAGKVKESVLLAIGLGIAATAAIGLLLVVLLGGSLPALLIPLFFVVASVGLVSATASALAMQSQGKNAGSAAAFLGLLPFILGAAVAPLVGLAGDRNALPMGIVIAVANAGAVLCYLFFVRGTRRFIMK